MAGISSKAAGKLENKTNKFQGQEYNGDFDVNLYEFKYRMDDTQTGRFWSVDPLASDYVHNSTYAFSENKVTGHIELEGLEAVVSPWISGAIASVASNPNSGSSKTFGTVAGIGNFATNTVMAPYNLIANPPDFSMQGSLNAGLQMFLGAKNAVNTLQSGTGFEKSALITEGIANIASLAYGFGELSVGKSGFINSSKISNPIPLKLARVVPNNGETITMLGRSTELDVFVTASSDIKGMNAAQISKRLAISESSTGYKVFEFDPLQGIATPINRKNPGFIGGGKTAGGAREFVVPNQSIPKNAIVKNIE